MRGPGTSSVQRRVIAASSAAWPLRQLLQPALEISQLLRIRNEEAVKNKLTQLPSQMSPHGSIAARLGPDGSAVSSSSASRQGPSPARPRQHGVLLAPVKFNQSGFWVQLAFRSVCAHHPQLFRASHIMSCCSCCWPLLLRSTHRKVGGTGPAGHSGISALFQLAR